MQRKWKRRWQRLAKTILPPIAAGLLMVSAYSPVFANPADGTVTSGSAVITANGSTMTINQATNKAVINWQNFSIGKGETVTFVQPTATSVALNRVVGNNASNIYGNLNANGRVYLINPNGILFAPGAQVSVGGLVASTLNSNDSDFTNGKYVFAKDGSAGSVVNQGTITAADHAVLIGPQVKNEGVIVARVASLVSGNKVSLDFTGDKLLNVTVDASAAGGSAGNTGTITANGGLVLMSTGTKDALLNTVVNNTGVVRAQTVNNVNGVIRLEGSTTNVGGTLDASAPNGGDGGFIETSGGVLNVVPGAKVTTLAPGGKTGRWLIDPNDFTIAASGGNMTADDVANALANNNFEIQTATMGTAGGNGDIFVNQPVHWSKNTKLTLSAQRNININAEIIAWGDSAGLILNSGSGGYNLNGGTITLLGSNSTFNLNGTDYTVIHSLEALQNMKNNPSGKYFLAEQLYVPETKSWNSGAGFAPIGGSNGFTGVFDGGGHPIDYLYINRPAEDNVGLFSHTGTTAVIRNVSLTHADIVGRQWVGSLAGWNEGTITNVCNSGNTGKVKAIGGYVGGLVGVNSGYITNAYNNYNVSTNANEVGGLAGANSGYIYNAYNTGDVSSGSYDFAGGIAGTNAGTIFNTYSTGEATGRNWSGGLVGDYTNFFAGSVSRSYYATTNKAGQPINPSRGSLNKAGEPKTLAELKDPATFAGWAIDDKGGTGNIWRIYSGNSTPLLRSFLQPLTVTATPDGKTYDGAVAAGSNLPYTPSFGEISGSLSYTTTSKNADTYRTTDGTLTLFGLYSSQKGYDISYDASLTINKANLTVTADNVTKTYDGTTAVTGGKAIAAGGTLFGSESLSGGTFAFTDKNAGTGKTVTVNNVTVNDGNGGNNYNVIYAINTTSTINKANLTVTANNASKTYDGLAYSGGNGVTYSGFVNGEGSSVLDDSLTYGGNSQGAKNANTYSITASGLTSGNYYITYNPGTLTINQAALTVGLTGSVTKAYDGDNTAALAAGNYTIGSGYVSGDAVSVANTVGSYDSKNAGSGKTVTITGLALSGADKDNYYIANAGGSVSGAVGTINKRNITVSAAADTKTYDGTVASSLTPTASWLAAGDALSGVQEYSDKNAGTGKTLSVTSYSINDGNSGNNYNVTAVNTNTTCIINQAALTVGLTGGVTKTYDGDNTAALAAGNYTIGSGYVSGDAVAVANTVGSYDSKNAGSGKTVTVTGLTLSGADKDNYYIANAGSVSGAVGTINKRDITVSAVADTKTYDGTTTSSLTPTVSWLATGDASSGVQEYSDKNAGTGKTLSVTSYSISDGNSGNNYNVTAVNTNTTGVINKRDITVSAAADTKTYDGTATSSLAPTASWLASGDALSGVQEYSDKNAGTGKTLSVTSYSVNDGNSGNNYNVTAVNTNTTSVINKRDITVSAAADTKTYDGTAASSLTPTASWLAAGDALSGVQEYSDKNAGTGKTLSVTNYSINDGNSGNNYKVTAVNTNTTGVINKAALTVGLTGGVTKTYDGDTTAALAAGNYTIGSGYVSGDAVAVANTVGSYDSKNAGSGKTVTVTGLTLSGADKDNYYIANASGSVSGAVGIINQAALTVGLIGSVTKTYDGDNTAALTAGNYTIGSGYVSGDAVSVANTVGSYDSKNVGSGKTVSVTGLTLSGADKDNYYIVNAGGSVSSAVGTINQRPITITPNAGQSKIYGVADPTLTYTAAGGPSTTGNAIVSGDTLSGSLTRETGSAVGNYLIEQGTLISANNPNYAISYSTTPVTFAITAQPVSPSTPSTPSTLTVTADNKTKVYGEANPSLTYSVGDGATTLSGSLACAAEASSAVGSYAITQGTLASGSNYSLSYIPGTLTVTPATLTVTAASLTKQAGQTTPPLTYSVSGLVGGDTAASVLSGSLAGATGSGPGSYAITRGTLAVNANYILYFTPSVLTVTGPAVNAAYDAAVVYAHQIPGGTGRPGPLSTYWSPVSGYMAGAAGSYVPLTIRGSGINTDGYVLWTALGSSGPIDNEPAKGVLNQ